ncbi:MAG: NADPH-dependent F420 reductase [Pseudoclavibacter sp.]
MTQVTIFGTGNMASAIASVLDKGGASVTQISHDQAPTATIEGDIVVFAVPYPAVTELVATHGAALAGKTVVDITNPLNFETFDSLVVPAGSSAAAEIQAALPNSAVIKAFNTNFAATLASGQVGETAATTVLIAGDDTAAKATLKAAIEAGGLGAIDAGSLQRAHELEALGFLQLTLAAGEQISWASGFNVVR